MQSRNFSYAYNEEYFEDLSQSGLAASAEAICGSGFDFSQDTPVSLLSDSRIGVFQRKEIVLYSTYPGVLMGTGYLHDLGAKGAIKTGFSLDYVTGMPYLPGSSLKGILRSVFPGRQSDDALSAELVDYLRELADDQELDVAALEEQIFDNGDVFIGAYPDLNGDEDKSLFRLDFITPHNKGRFKDPIPISIMRVRPGVAFRFVFLLRDSVVEGKVYTADKKLDIFRQILLDMGVGAKTNVGYGKFAESRIGSGGTSQAVQDKATIKMAVEEKTETVTVEEIHIGFPEGYVVAKRGAKRYVCRLPYEELGNLREGKSKLTITFKANGGDIQDGMPVATGYTVARR